MKTKFAASSDTNLFVFVVFYVYFVCVCERNPTKPGEANSLLLKRRNGYFFKVENNSNS